MRRAFTFLWVIALLAMPLAAADLTGVWNFTWYTPDGEIEATIEFKQDGDKLTAEFDEDTLVGSVGEEQFEMKGEYFSEEAGYSAILEFTGTEEDGKLTGEGFWDVYDLTFEAVRAD